MKFTCKEDGSEWEGKVDNDQPEMMWIERIQPKEKSLYETLLTARLMAETENGAQNVAFHLLYFTIEALERKLDDSIADKETAWKRIQALEKRVEEQERKLNAIERACERHSDTFGTNVLSSYILEELKK